MPGQRVLRPLLFPRQGRFDSLLVEPGPPALRTESGVLLVYNGANHFEGGDPSLPPLSYQPGQALFDNEEPASCIARTVEPFLRADTVGARMGQVANVCFTQSLVLFRGRWHLYFGMADSRIGCAVAPATPARGGENGDMTASDAPHPEWDDSYVGPPPPWDIGRPQPAFIRLAEAGALTGALLDAGCGTGEHTILAARHGARALGIDVSRRAIEIARRKAAERGIDTSFQVLDALHLDALGEPFDTIIDSGLFHVFDDAARIQYVTAVHAALRVGGHLHLACFCDRQPGDWGPRRVTEGELRAAFESGWRIDSLAPARFDINPGFGTATAEAWLADVVRLAPR